MKNIIITLLFISIWSCKKTEIQNLEVIDRTTDNPQNKANFMKDVKTTILNSYGIIGEISYSAIWDENLKTYKLLPQAYLDIPKLKSISQDVIFEKDPNKEEISLVFNIADEMDNLRINWLIPYRDLIPINNIINLHSTDFDKYINKTALSKGTRQTPVIKHSAGYVAVRFMNKDGIFTNILLLFPFYFGKD